MLVCICVFLNIVKCFYAKLMDIEYVDVDCWKFVGNLGCSFIYQCVQSVWEDRVKGGNGLSLF